MTDKQREAFEKAWEEFKASLIKETPFKQIHRFLKWIPEKIYTVWHR